MVDHPNIVKLIEVFEDERHICIVMELLQGGTILDRFKQQDEYYEEEVRAIVI